MALTPSTMLDLGTTAPEFSLSDTDGKTISLADYPDANAYLIMFICNHCPYVKHVADKLAKLARAYQERGVAVFGINSNDVDNYPDDAPDKMKQEKEQRGYTFAYLSDDTQEVAKAYQAACTPDFYVFNSQRQLAYRGQMDDSRPESGIAVTGADLRSALDAVLEGSAMLEEQKASLGCNIKWKPGNDPDYA